MNWDVELKIKTDLAFLYIAILFSFLVVWPVLFPFVLGIILAFVSEPAVSFIEKKLQPRNYKWRWLISFLVIFSIILVFAIPLFLFILNGVQQLLALARAQENISFPEKINEGLIWAVNSLQRFGIKVTEAEIFAKAKEWFGKSAEIIASFAATFLSATPTLLFDLTLTFMSWFFFLVRGPQIRAIVLPFLIPWSRQREIICSTTGEVIRSIVLANILVSIIQAFTVWIVLAIANVPHASLFAGIAFFMSFVPVVGTAPIMIGSAIFLYFNQSIGMSFFVLFGSVVTGLIDNFLRPLLVRGSTELSFFWVFIAFVGGISQFGVAGALLGPLAFSLFVAAYRSLDKSEVN